MSRFFLATLLLIAIAVPARPAVGPEQTVRSGGVVINGLVSTTSGFLLAWTELTGVLNELVVQTIDARGEMTGNPLRFPASNPVASLGSDGDSTLLAWSEGKSIRGAWVGDRWASESFLIANVAADIIAISVAGNDGRFAVAWAETGKAVHLATIPTRGTAIERHNVIAPDDAVSVQIAAGTDRVLVHWNKRPRNCCPGGYDPTARVAYASWELAVSPAAELYPSQDARSVLPLPAGNFAIARDSSFYGEPHLLFLSPQSLEGKIFTKPWAIPAALTLWRGNLTVLWERVLTDGFAGDTYLSVERDFTPTREPPPAFSIRRGRSVVGARLASSDSLVIAAYEAYDSVTRDLRLVYRAVTPDDLSTLPARPDPPAIQSQTSGRETVDLEVHTSGDWIEIAPLDNPQAKPRAFQRNQVLKGLPGDTLYSFRTFAENEQGFVPSSAVTFRTIPAFTTRPPLWLRTTDNLNGTWTIEWTDLSSNETSFRIMVLNPPANDLMVMELPPNSTKATIKAPSAGRIAIASMNGSQASLTVTGAAKPLPNAGRRRAGRK